MERLVPADTLAKPQPLSQSEAKPFPNSHTESPFRVIRPSALQPG